MKLFAVDALIQGKWVKQWHTLAQFEIKCGDVDDHVNGLLMAIKQSEDRVLIVIHANRSMPEKKIEAALLERNMRGKRGFLLYVSGAENKKLRPADPKWIHAATRLIRSHADLSGLGHEFGRLVSSLDQATSDDQISCAWAEFDRGPGAIVELIETLSPLAMDSSNRTGNEVNRRLCIKTSDWWESVRYSIDEANDPSASALSEVLKGRDSVQLASDVVALVVQHPGLMLLLARRFL